jgi:hypothetical protein
VVVGDVIVTSGTDGIYPRASRWGRSVRGSGAGPLQGDPGDALGAAREIEAVLVVKGAAADTSFDESVK